MVICEKVLERRFKRRWLGPLECAAIDKISERSSIGVLLDVHDFDTTLDSIG